MAGRAGDDEKMRFQIELEFVQCFANPNYLNFLAQRGYFKQKAFINYLNYLTYWKRPEYAKRELSSSQCAKFIEDQQLLHWQHYIRKRMRLLQKAVTGIEQNNTPAST